MEYRELNRTDSNNQMQKWIQLQEEPPICEEELQFRKYLTYEYEKIKSKYASDSYSIDLHFGLVLYKALESMGNFTMRIAANDGYWRYLSLMIIPKLVTDRWGKDNESHFWGRSTRIWVRQIWWFIHLSLQMAENSTGYDLDRTEKILSQKCFSTDEIMNLVERAGRKGTYVEVYREIIRMYSLVPDSERLRHREGRKTLFRKVMILHTAKSVVVDPYLYEIDDYVYELFEDLGVKFNQ